MCVTVKSGHGLTTSFGSNPEWRSSRVPSTEIKQEDYQLAVSAENRVPDQEKGKVLGKVTSNPFFMFWMVAFVSLLPRHWFFPTICYSISNRLPCPHVYVPLLPIPVYSFYIPPANGKLTLCNGYFILKREFC